jgi:hypothetical protein
MQEFEFGKATKKKSKLRLLISGPSGSGKTFTSLSITKPFGRGAVIDTEHGSASLYADRFDFDVLEMDTPTMENCITAIGTAEAAGYDWILCDSLTHYWSDALESVDRESNQFGGNKWAAWSKITPRWNKMVNKIITCKCHIICTSRSKTDYVIEDAENGKKRPRKVGMAPILRDQMEYEFTLAATMDLDHNLFVTKTRCPQFADRVIPKPTEAVGKELLDWLDTGEYVPEPSVVDQVRDLLQGAVECKSAADFETAVQFATDHKHHAAECKDPKIAAVVLEAMRTTNAHGVPFSKFLTN